MIKLFPKFWKKVCNWISQNWWDNLVWTETSHAFQISLMTFRMTSFCPHNTLQTCTGQYNSLQSCWNVPSF